jgi:hypothetical protein
MELGGEWAEGGFILGVECIRDERQVSLRHRQQVLLHADEGKNVSAYGPYELCGYRYLWRLYYLCSVQVGCAGKYGY